MRISFAGREEAWRDLVGFAAFLLSALVVVAGFVAEGWQWAALGVAVGGPGVVLPHLAKRKGWPRGQVWVLLVVILVCGFGAMSAISGTSGT